jgi:uncharacterized membrane protein
LESIILILFYLLFPAVILYLCYRSPLINKIGAVIMCYLVGMLVGNYFQFSTGLIQIQETFTEVTVALALPFLLFSMDIKAWKRLAGKATLSMLLAVIAIMVVSLIGFIIIHDTVPYGWQLGGMAVGLYTGGTPNLAAIKTAINVDADVYISMHTYDTVVSVIFILFFCSVAQRLFNMVLPKFKKKDYVLPIAGSNEAVTESIDSYVGIFRRSILLPLLRALGVAALVVGASLGISGFFSAEYATAAVILSITTFSICCSLIPKIRAIKKTFQVGMYFIYIFCIAVGSMANLKQLFTQVNWPIMYFVLFCIFGSLLLHALLCKLCKIDTDTFIITSTSAICSPPFVPVVANALKNKEIIISGIYTGIIGYAIGNYLGITYAYILRSLFRLIRAKEVFRCLAENSWPCLNRGWVGKMS